MLGRCTNYGGGVGEMQSGVVSWARGAYTCHIGCCVNGRFIVVEMIPRRSDRACSKMGFGQFTLHNSPPTICQVNWTPTADGPRTVRPRKYILRNIYRSEIRIRRDLF
jgi:hypothetical protein